MGNNESLVTIQPQVIQIYRYNQLYGRHQIYSNHVIKEYHVPLDQHDHFLSLLESYQQISVSSVMKIIKVQPNHGHQHNHYLYNIVLPYYASSLTAQIYQRKLHPYSERQVLTILADISSALQAFVHHRFSFGYLIPDKIAINQGKQGGYLIGLDILLNQENLLDRHNKSNNETLNKYMSPQQLQPNHNINLKDGVSSNIYSLGLITLKMMLRQDFNRKDIPLLLFNLRQKYSLKLLKVIRSMLSQDISFRISITTLILRIEELKRQVDSHQQLIENQSFIQGYNCLEYLDWDDDQELSLQVKIKWKSSRLLK